MNSMYGILANIFCVFYAGSTRKHIKKIFVSLCNTDARKTFFSVLLILRCNSQTEEVVSTPSIGKFKTLLRVFLGEALFDFVQFSFISWAGLCSHLFSVAVV